MLLLLTWCATTKVFLNLFFYSRWSIRRKFNAVKNFLFKKFIQATSNSHKFTKLNEQRRIFFIPLLSIFFYLINFLSLLFALFCVLKWNKKTFFFLDDKSWIVAIFFLVSLIVSFFFPRLMLLFFYSSPNNIWWYF